MSRVSQRTRSSRFWTRVAGARSRSDRRTSAICVLSGHSSSTSFRVHDSPPGKASRTSTTSVTSHGRFSDPCTTTSSSDSAAGPTHLRSRSRTYTSTGYCRSRSGRVSSTFPSVHSPPDTGPLVPSLVLTRPPSPSSSVVLRTTERGGLGSSRWDSVGGRVGTRIPGDLHGWGYRVRPSFLEFVVKAPETEDVRWRVRPRQVPDGTPSSLLSPGTVRCGTCGVGGSSRGDDGPSPGLTK